MGIPGCPHFARSTASIDNARMALAMLRSPADVAKRPAAGLAEEAACAGEACALVILENPLETSGLSEGGPNRQVSALDHKQECSECVDIGTDRLEDVRKGGRKWKGWMLL